MTGMKSSLKKVSFKVMIFIQHHHHLDNDYAENMSLMIQSLMINSSNQRVHGSVQKIVLSISY